MGPPIEIVPAIDSNFEGTTEPNGKGTVQGIAIEKRIVSSTWIESAQVQNVLDVGTDVEQSSGDSMGRTPASSLPC